MKIKSIRRATAADRPSTATTCGSSAADSPDKPPC